MDMDLGDTRLIVSECLKRGVLRNQAAYILATAFWETGRTMKPVKEAFWVKDAEAWRQNNLRYWPWYGRGYVQLTWERNYIRAGNELGVDLTTDPDDVMKVEHAVPILVIGSMEGWFTGKKISDYITLTASNYRGARRVINGTDKAAAIAEIARDYEAQLLLEGYGVEKPAPVVNERRDGTAPRTSPIQSTTNLSVIGGGLAVVGNLSDQVKGAVGAITDNFGVSPEFALTAVALIALAWIFRERLRKWAEGDR